MFEAGSQEELGMLNAEHAWIMPEGTSFLEETYDDSDPQRTRRQLHGLLSLQASPIFADGYARFTEMWARSTPADCQNSLFAVNASIFAQPPDPNCAFAYDSVIAIALALGAAAPSRDGDTVQRLLRRLSFDGASGQVEFKPNGDRSPVGVKVILEPSAGSPEYDVHCMQGERGGGGIAGGRPDTRHSRWQARCAREPLASR